MSLKKVTLNTPNPKTGKSYINVYIETEGVHPVTVDHLISDLKADPTLLQDREIGPINEHRFEIKTEGSWLLGDGKKVIRLKEK